MQKYFQEYFLVIIFQNFSTVVHCRLKLYIIILVLKSTILPFRRIDIITNKLIVEEDKPVEKPPERRTKRLTSKSASENILNSKANDEKQNDLEVENLQIQIHEAEIVDSSPSKLKIKKKSSEKSKSMKKIAEKEASALTLKSKSDKENDIIIDISNKESEVGMEDIEFQIHAVIEDDIEIKFEGDPVEIPLVVDTDEVVKNEEVMDVKSENNEYIEIHQDKEVKLAIKLDTGVSRLRSKALAKRAFRESKQFFGRRFK